MTVWRATVESGIGLAAEEMSLTPSEVWSALGYTPVDGTLNLRCEKPLRAAVRRQQPTVTWRPSETKDVTPFFPVTVNGFPCHARALQRTIEVVAPIRLRVHFGLQDGDPVEVTLP